MLASPYSDQFYIRQKDGSISSARVIVSLIMRLLNPSSVIDIGCGTGTWLSVFREHQVEDVWGIDGTHVKKEALLIPSERFIAHDLSKPLKLNRSFDLVVSMEVGEHLPSQATDVFIETLVRLGPAVLFSAAIPFQGGTAHINEQWQNYWARRFRAHNFLPIDCIRTAVWDHPGVQFFYAQNALLYVHRDLLKKHPELESHAIPSFPAALSVVHPETFLNVADPARWSTRQAFKFFRAVLAARLKARLISGTKPVGHVQ